MMGSLRIDETIMPIISLRLVRGGIEVIAMAHGPMSEYEGHVRLFTGEGLPVTDGAIGETGVVRVPRIGPGQTAQVVYLLTIEYVHSDLIDKENPSPHPNA